MLYLDNFYFPTAEQEGRFLYPKDLTPDEVGDGVWRDFSMRYFEDSIYPFDIMPRNQFRCIDFDPITILCGGNGSGKTTALNIIAEKLGLNRDSLFNKGELYDKYLKLCDYNRTDSSAMEPLVKKAIPANSRIIVSDDVFQHNMKIREMNDSRVYKKWQVEGEYEQLKFDFSNMDIVKYFDRRKESRMLKAKYMRKHLGDEERREYSNGESGFRYFVERIEEPGLYLLDEPENSLSMKKQQELAEFLRVSSWDYDCQFVIATHSPIFLSIRGAKIYDLDVTPVDVLRDWTEVDTMREWYEFFMSHKSEFSRWDDFS